MGHYHWPAWLCHIWHSSRKKIFVREMHIFVFFCKFYLELFSIQEGFGKILSYVYLDLVKCQDFFPILTSVDFLNRLQ
jgi:hypothetical protein